MCRSYCQLTAIFVVGLVVLRCSAHALKVATCTDFSVCLAGGGQSILNMRWKLVHVQIIGGSQSVLENWYIWYVYMQKLSALQTFWVLLCQQQGTSLCPIYYKENLNLFRTTQFTVCFCMQLVSEGFMKLLLSNFGDPLTLSTSGLSTA